MSINTVRAIENVSGRRLSLGATIWAMRMCDDLSQVIFAQKLGVSKQYLCDLEHDRKRVSPKQAAKFANILGYPVKSFVRLALQDLLIENKLHFEVELKEVA